MSALASATSAANLRRPPIDSISAFVSSQRRSVAGDEADAGAGRGEAARRGAPHPGAGAGDHHDAI
jgi:hypothetical protein